MHIGFHRNPIYMSFKPNIMSGLKNFPVWKVTLYVYAAMKDSRNVCYIYRISGNRDLAEEVVQDVFTRLWTHRNGFDPLKPIKPYLLTSARNAFIDKKRRQAVRKSSNIEVHRETIEDKQIHNPNLNELQNVLEKTLARLNPDEREVFILSRMEDMKYHEIAGVLGISIKTVEARMKRALEHLRINLKPFLE